jgi:hypothetical protein
VKHKEHLNGINDIFGVTKDLNEIVVMNDIVEERLGVIHKVGHKTGNTMANHIGTVVLYMEKAVEDKLLYASSGKFENGLALKFGKHYLIVHCPSSSVIDGIPFTIPGDSGGLCYIETGDILKGVGICIGRISASNFYLILPLALIEAVYKEKGYTVRWNENTDDDEDLTVDDVDDAP